MFSNLLQYPSGEVTDPGWELNPCYPLPLPPADAPSPESFDQECNNDEAIIKFKCPPEQMDVFFPSSHDTNPTVSAKISTLSAFRLTYSADSSYKIASCQYSFDVTSSGSDYLNSSELETRGLHTMQKFISSAKSTDCLPYNPPHNSPEAHGTVDRNPNLTDDCSTVIQRLESLTVDPAAPSTHVISDGISDSQARLVPVKRPFKCLRCSYSFARMYNLNMHIATHYEVPKRIECSTCGRQFSRMHDLRRHLAAIRGEQTSSSSASSLFSRFDPRRELLQYRTTTISGDERLASTDHPDSFSATGLEGPMACWENAHNEVSERFGCSTCSCQFSRKHDLRRHRIAKHGGRMSSSASSLSSHRFDPRRGLPRYRTTTISGDERLMSSHHPGSFSGRATATGLDGLMASWENATWLQGA